MGSVCIFELREVSIGDLRTDTNTILKLQQWSKVNNRCFFRELQAVKLSNVYKCLAKVSKKLFQVYKFCCMFNFLEENSLLELECLTPSAV